MKKIRLTNTTETEMTISFEPIGDLFDLPANGHLELSVFDEEVGLGDCSLNIVVGAVNEKKTVTIFAEKNNFEARHKGQLVSVM